MTDKRTLRFSMEKFAEELEEALLRFDDPTFFDVSETYSAVYHRFLALDLKDRPAIRGQLKGPVSFGFNILDLDVLSLDVYTNANWDDMRFTAMIREGLKRRNEIKAKFLAAYKAKNGRDFDGSLPEAATWSGGDSAAFAAKAKTVGVRATENEDVRSLRELLTIGLKGIAAYADHAAILGFQKEEVNDFMMEALASTTKALSVDEMVALVMKAGETAVSTMALLDEANTTAYGNPEITEVNIGVGTNPGILISGHDLKDMEELLQQTEGTGIDVYTHGEMLPANCYPAFKKHGHFVGNYGGSWWHQNKEFESFNGPILLTTNCLVPLKKDNTYLDRLFTTGVVGYEAAVHIADRPAGGTKDFSLLIEKAKTCPPPTEIETGTIVGGFAHNQVLALADKVVDAVKSGAIRRFVVMAGCDGRQKARSYYTEVAQNLPSDTVILTAGCAKYRYNKLALGDIGGIPRVLDAGQCNDSYSLAVIALKLSHGQIYDRPSWIMEAYRDWILGAPQRTVVLPYVSMHASTKRMVDHLVGSLVNKGVRVELFNLTVTDIGKLAMALVDAGTIVVGTPTVLAGPHPLAAYAAFLANALRPKAQFLSIVGSYGWGGKTVETLAGLIPNLKVEVLDPVLCKGVPSSSDFEALNLLADTIARKHKERGFN